MSLQIRRYQRADHAQVLQLHKVALEAVDAYAAPGPWDDDLDDIERNYLGTGGEFLVGVLGADVVAMGALRRIDEDTAELKRMRVSPSRQRQGFGRQMLQTLEARARNLGYTTVVLDTSDRQTAAIALYRTHGYLEVGRGELAGLPALFFRKTLASATIEGALAEAVDDRSGTAISG
jgi:ribosomal protein S18 acetylase RimI-like enzyme